ncbi:MAG: hypothetical protein A2X66_01015 [Ignavibacteria bacterium GWA2_54_16]|nr:MAG: hypothetical protein A2X66_01015 [Ignavibacteria bacterium GWA2_54_16]
MLQNAINWFEIPVADFERAKKFYSTIYDFDMPEFPMGPHRTPKAIRSRFTRLRNTPETSSLLRSRVTPFQ